MDYALDKLVGFDISNNLQVCSVASFVVVDIDHRHLKRILTTSILLDWISVCVDGTHVLHLNNPETARPNGFDVFQRFLKAPGVEWFARAEIDGTVVELTHYLGHLFRMLGHVPNQSPLDLSLQSFEPESKLAYFITSDRSVFPVTGLGGMFFVTD